MGKPGLATLKLIYVYIFPWQRMPLFARLV